jgi:hypothetical protein
MKSHTRQTIDPRLSMAPDLSQIKTSVVLTGVQIWLKSDFIIQRKHPL